MNHALLFERIGLAALLSAACWAQPSFAKTDPKVRDAHLTTSVGSGTAFDSSHGNNWSDRKVPTDDKTYYIPGNLYATVGGACHGKWVYNEGLLYASGSMATWTELRMAPGGRYEWWSQVGIAGRVVIEGTEGNPSRFTKGHPRGKAEVEISADFASDDSSSCARFDMSGEVAAGVALPDYTWQMTGDWSGYEGTVIVGKEMCLEWRRDNASVPGTVDVEAGGYLTVGKTALSADILNMRDGSILRVRSVDRGVGTVPVSVADVLTLGKVRVMIDGAFYEPGRNVSMPVFRIGAAAAEQGFDLTGLAVDESGFRTGPLPLQVEFTVEDDAEVPGGKIVRLVIGDRGADVYTMNVANDTADEAGSAFTPGNESYWTDRKVPQADATGYLLANKTICWTGDRRFLYDDLSLVARDAWVYVQCEALGLKDIHLCGNLTMSSYVGADKKDVYGDIYLGGDFRYLVYGKKTVNLHGNIHGDRDMTISTPTPNLNPIGSMGLFGDNRDFHGGIAVTAKSDHRDPATTEWRDYRYPLTWANPPRYFTLTLTNENALGGAYVGDAAWKSFHVNCAALVMVMGDVRFVEPTRGMYVEGEGQIYVANGKRLTLGVPLTLGGRMSKNGPGVLELGGEARFIDGNPATEPLAGTNVFAVAGPVKISSVNAVNGMSIEFKKDATLLLDFRPQGTGMTETGFKATRWATPFTVNTADGRIPVAFDDGTPTIDNSVLDYRLPICTVPAAVAETVKFALPKVAHRKLKMEKRANADGSVTLVANYAKSGMCVFIK